MDYESLGKKKGRDDSIHDLVTEEKENRKKRTTRKS